MLEELEKIIINVDIIILIVEGICKYLCNFKREDELLMKWRNYRG